jgi:deoxyhypusine synthase
MTEFNYFCYSEEFDSVTSFQQPRYRVFNTQLNEEEYNKIEKIIVKLEFNNDEDKFRNAFNGAFQKLSQEDKDKIINLP